MSDLRQGRLLACFIFSAALCATLAAAEAQRASGPASKLSVTVQPQGSASREKPLPAGANATLNVTVRNETSASVGPITLTAKFEGLKAAEQPEWKTDGDKISGTVDKLEPGASVERRLRLRVEKAPFPAARTSVTIEASAEKLSGSGSASFMIADCTGNFREKLGVLRPAILQNVRDTAEAMRKPESSLPGGRTFPLTNSRKGDIMAAERLSTPLSARQAADAQMSTEWMRFLISRWVSELNTYATQPAHPGLCANNYYQIAGYREGLLPVTKRLDGFRDSAQHALAAARIAANDNAAASAHGIILKIADTAGVQGIDPNASAFALLATIRSSIARGTKLEPAQMEALSLAETAAWLQETDKRGQALNGAIEKVLGTIAQAHKESCVCAF